MVETFVYLTLKDLLYYMHSKNTKIKLTINMCIDLFKIIRLKNEMESGTIVFMVFALQTNIFGIWSF